MKTQNQPTFEELRMRATPGPYSTTSSIRRDYVAVLEGECTTYPVAIMEGALDARLANADLITRLLNTFVHGDGVRVLREIQKSGLMSPKNYDELVLILAQLDGSPNDGKVTK